MCALKDGACNKYKEENAEVHRFCGSGGADGTADKEKCRVENDAQHEHAYKAAAAVLEKTHKILNQQCSEYCSNGEHTHCDRIEAFHLKIVFE